MKIPILVVCVAVIYGTLGIYAEKSVDIIKGITHDSNYISKYPNAPLVKSLSRQKRCLIRDLMSPLEMGLRIVGFAGDNVLTRSVSEFRKFVNDILLCSTNRSIEKLSIDLVEQMMLHPIETTKDIWCYFLNAMESQSNEMIRATTSLLSQAFFRMFLPGLHTVLNYLADAHLLPLSLMPMVEMFNLLYTLLKLMGYVP